MNAIDPKRRSEKGAERSTMDALAEAAATADKVLVF